MALVDQKHNTETARNSYPIIMFQGGPLYRPYFIAIDNMGQIIIGSSKKTVATYVKIVDSGLYFISSFHFILLYFSFSFFFFLFLEQLGLGVISNAVTSVTK